MYPQAHNCYLLLHQSHPSEYLASVGLAIGHSSSAQRNKVLSSAMISRGEVAWNEQQEACVEWYDSVIKLQDHNRVNINREQCSSPATAAALIPFFYPVHR